MAYPKLVQIYEFFMIMIASVSKYFFQSHKKPTLMAIKQRVGHPLNHLLKPNHLMNHSLIHSLVKHMFYQY